MVLAQFGEYSAYVGGNNLRLSIGPLIQKAYLDYDLGENSHNYLPLPSFIVLKLIETNRFLVEKEIGNNDCVVEIVRSWN